jgi:hypothetical protein
MLTYGDLKNHILLALGGRPSTASGQTVAERQAEIVNIAGEHLFTHPWKFREATANISTVAAQQYLALPADFAELTSVWKSNQPIWISTPDEVETARITSFPDLTYRVYVKTVVPSGDTAGSSVAQSYQLQIYPTPTGVDTLKILYRTGWSSVTSSTSTTTIIPVPKHVESTMIAYTRAVAEAYEDDGLPQRLAEIEAGPIFGAAKQKDGMVQSHFGQLQPNRWRSPSNWGPGFVILNPVQSPT